MRDLLAFAVGMGRELALDTFIDTCTVRPVVAHDTDEAGNVTDVYGPAVYGPGIAPHMGRCKVQTSETVQANPDAGGATFTVQRLRVDFPVGSFRPAVDLVIEMETAALDPHLAGRRFRVVALLHKTAATAYRLMVEEVSS